MGLEREGQSVGTGVEDKEQKASFSTGTSATPQNVRLTAADAHGFGRRLGSAGPSRATPEAGAARVAVLAGGSTWAPMSQRVPIFQGLFSSGISSFRRLFCYWFPRELAPVGSNPISLCVRHSCSCPIAKQVTRPSPESVWKGSSEDTRARSLIGS